MEAEILSQRGKEKCHHNGYLYTFDKCSKTDATVKFWRCERLLKIGENETRCKGRIHTRNGQVIKELNEHAHFSSAASVASAKVVTKIKRQAEVTAEGTVVVINSCLINVPQSVESTLPTNLALQKVIRRKRNQIRTAPSDPNSLQELVIPESYKVYTPQLDRNELFLLSDSGAGPDRILIFGRASWIQFLHGAAWYADGTFSTAPRLFSQLYTIMAEKLGGIIPIFYALLPNKQRNTYTQMFEMVKQLHPGLNPKSIHCDFEQAAMLAMKESFQGVVLNGCFFHLVQNMLRHLSEIGLTHQYNNDPDFSLKARMIIALAFVKICDLDHYFDVLSEYLPIELEPLLDWFEDNYIGRIKRCGYGRRQPLFPPEIWNVYDRTITGDTNNHAEAAHCIMRTELGMQHPTLWKFIDRIRKVQKGRDTYYEQLVAGHQPPLKLKKYREADDRILNIVLDYENRDAIEYLRGISQNYQMAS